MGDNRGKGSGGSKGVGEGRNSGEIVRTGGRGLEGYSGKVRREAEGRGWGDLGKIEVKKIEGNLGK